MKEERVIGGQALNSDKAKKVNKNKDSTDYIKNKIDYYASQSQSMDHSDMVKARSYYNRTRDNKDYAYLEDNFGIGNPMDLKFSPDTTTRVDILVGILASQEIKSQVSAIDKDTISKEELDIMIQKSKMKKDAVKLVAEDVNLVNVEEISNKLKDKIEEVDEFEFISDYQKGSQDIINFFLESNEYNITDFKDDLFLDVLVTGDMIYRENPVIKNEYPTVSKVLPEDTYFIKQKGSKDVGTADGISNVRYLTKRQVMMELGHNMTEKQKKEFLRDTSINKDTGKTIVTLENINGDNSLPSLSESLYNDTYQYLNDYVEVIHVEYKETKEVSYEEWSLEDKVLNLLGKKKLKKKKISKEFRYSGYRIGNYYYIDLGIDKDAKRNVLNPRKVEFTYKGVSLNEQGKKLSSIVYNLIDIQDLIDMMIFHRGNFVANGGVNGSRVDAAAIPAFLGEDMMDRLFKFKALSKQGLQIFDSTQTGSEQFNHYGDFNNSISFDAIQAFNAILLQLEKQADQTAGINPSMRGIVEQREAVSNVKTGITMISYATKKYFKALDYVFEKSLFSLIDDLKDAFPNGFSGSYYKAGNKHAFNVAPEYYRSSIFLVSIKRDDTDVIQLEKLKGMISELAGANLMDPKSMLLAQTATSTQEVESLALKGFDIAAKKNDVVGKLNQQVQEMQSAIEQRDKQLEEVTKEVKLLQKKDLDLKEKEIALKKKEIESNFALARDKAVDNKEIEEKKIEQIEKRTALEREQIVAGGVATEVRNLN